MSCSRWPVNPGLMDVHACTSAVLSLKFYFFEVATSWVALVETVHRVRIAKMAGPLRLSIRGCGA
jgi:hypothetical protein